MTYPSWIYSPLKVTEINSYGTDTMAAVSMDSKEADIRHPVTGGNAIRLVVAVDS